jgi:RNA polymerase sigma-70 factor (ECF subfamily)
MAAAKSEVVAQVPDDELIRRTCDGDQAAFNVLYDRYFPRVYGFVNRRMRSRADTEETVQEVFINIFSSLASFRGEASFAAWTLGVARRTVAGRFKKKRHVTVPLEDQDSGEGSDVLDRACSDGPSPLDHYECAERIARLETAARDELTPDQRQLFELHHLEHRSVRDIARDLNFSEDAVKSHLYRARKLLLAR